MTELTAIKGGVTENTPRQTRVYLAGPMRGVPRFNADAFIAATDHLRKLGREVRSPQERDDKLGLDFDNPDLEAQGFDVKKAMKAGIENVIWCDEVVVLGDWFNSAGATLEVRVAWAIGKTVRELSQLGSELTPAAPMTATVTPTPATVVTQRQAVYGHPFENFSAIGRLWAPIIERFGCTPEAVALCMVQVKLARLLYSPDHPDSQLDVHGYVQTYADVRERRAAIQAANATSEQV